MKILQTLDLKINFLVDSIINFAQISSFVHDNLMKRKKDY